MQITVVVPTYNEAENLPELVSALFALPLEGLRLLVVDDNSPDGTGALLLYRPKANLAKDRVFTIWVDGKQVDQIMDDEQRLLSLPSGPHTLVIRSAGRSSQPMQFTIRPSARVRLVCQPARPVTRGAAPDLWVFPYYEEALQRRALTRKEQAWLAVRTLLIILLVSGLIGSITYIAFYMAWN